LLACGLPWGCGSPGPPLPPSLELAQPVRDLRAVRKGDRVSLSWSVPVETTDKQNIHHSGVTQVCRSLAPEPVSCNPPLSSIPASALPATKKTTSKIEAAFVDTLPPGLERDHASSTLHYAVRVLNSYGRTAGLSNEVSVPSAPTLSPPSALGLELQREGVNVSWNSIAAPALAGVRFLYRIYRREDETGPDQVVGELPLEDTNQPSVIDRNFEWEKRYQYYVTVVTVVLTGPGAEQEVEGEDSQPKQILTHDIFRPATPRGLQAVFSDLGAKPFMDLVWTPNTDADLAGYDVYRREEGSPAIKLNREPLHQSAYRDSDITLGKRYFYSVSAVDVRGNESQRSEEASETAPAR
jgi:hypothetical protein